jgi:hypothetical protein
MSKPATIPALDRARSAWGDALPDWVEALAIESDRTSQSKAAMRIGRSAATVSNVINNAYSAGLQGVEQLVRAALMSASVNCPVIGEMSSSACLENQNAEWSARRAMIQAACAAGCPHSRVGGSK